MVLGGVLIDMYWLVHAQVGMSNDELLTGSLVWTPSGSVRFARKFMAISKHSLACVIPFSP